MLARPLNAIGAIGIASLCAVSASCSLWASAGTFRGNYVGGPLTVDGPFMVQGPLTIGGPATVHGSVRARLLMVGGPVDTSLPSGERAGPAGQTVAGPLVIGGPLTVHGPLLVDGALKVGGPLTTEASGPQQMPDPEPLQYQQSLQDSEQTL